MNRLEKAARAVTVMLKYTYEHIHCSCGFMVFSNVSIEFCCIFVNYTLKKLTKCFSFLMSRRYDNQNVILCDVAL